MVRPGQLFRVAVTVLKAKQPLTVRASIQRNGVEMSADFKDIKEGIPETLLMKVRFIKSSTKKKETEPRGCFKRIICTPRNNP